MAGAGYVGEMDIAFVLETIVSGPLWIFKTPSDTLLPRTQADQDRIIGVAVQPFTALQTDTIINALFSLPNPHATTWQRIYGFQRQRGVFSQIQD